jgi:hypothetical protein
MNFIEWVEAALEFSDEEVNAVFNRVLKCKYKWEVLEVKDIKPTVNWCFSTLKITTQLRDWNTILLQNWFSWNPCEARDNMTIEYSRVPKLWETIYWILNIENGYILRAWKEYYDIYSEIPECNREMWKIPQESYSQNYIFFGLSICLVIIFSWIFFLWKFSKNNSKKKKN